MIKVLFVCTANYIRSPAAQVLADLWIQSNQLDEKIYVDSAGTHGTFVGKPPDLRIQSRFLERGIKMDQMSAKQIQLQDFEYYDYVVAMSELNLEALRSLAPESKHKKISLLLSFDENASHKSVPDPFSGEDSFDNVIKIIENGVNGFMNHLREKHQLR